MAASTAAIIVGSIIAGAAAVGSTAISASASRKSKSQSMPSGGSGAAQADLDAAKEAASIRAEEAQKKKAAALKRSRTVYTSPLGQQTEASTAKKQLLGQ